MLLPAADFFFFGSTESDEKEVSHKEELICEVVHPWEPMGSVPAASASITCGMRGRN